MLEMFLGLFGGKKEVTAQITDDPNITIVSSGSMPVPAASKVALPAASTEVTCSCDPQKILYCGICKVTRTTNALPWRKIQGGTTTTAPVTPPKPKKTTLDCYFEERAVCTWWFGVEDKYGDSNHPYDHYGTFPTFGDAYEHMAKCFGSQVAPLDYDIYPQKGSSDDSWVPVQAAIDLKKKEKK